MNKKVNNSLKEGLFVNFFYHNNLFFPKDNKARPAIFLDRDGVIIKERHFISNKQDVELELGVNELFDVGNNLEIPIIIITNQSGIARSLFKWEDYLEVSEEMLNLIRSNNSLIAIYANGLNADATEYTWRKPSPNMILNAAFSLKIDLSKSIFIGDRLTDLISGYRAGIFNLFHLKTGHGAAERKKVINYFKKKDLRTNLFDELNSSSLEIITNTIKNYL